MADVRKDESDIQQKRRAYFERCHADLVENIAHGGDVSCVRCHASVGHLR